MYYCGLYTIQAFNLDDMVIFKRDVEVFPGSSKGFKNAEKYCFQG